MKVGAVIVCPRHGTVDIGDDDDIVPVRIFIANTKLPFDGLLGLPFAGIAGIDDADALPLRGFPVFLFFHVTPPALSFRFSIQHLFTEWKG